MAFQDLDRVPNITAPSWWWFMVWTFRFRQESSEPVRTRWGHSRLRSRFWASEEDDLLLQAEGYMPKVQTEDLCHLYLKWHEPVWAVPLAAVQPESSVNDIICDSSRYEQRFLSSHLLVGRQMMVVVIHTKVQYIPSSLRPGTYPV